MSFTHPQAARREHPTGEWMQLLTNPSRKVLEVIARAAVVCEYTTARSAAAVAGISTDAAHGYLELLTDLGVTSEILPWDRQNGRAVFADRSTWEQVQTTLRRAPLR